MQELRGRYDIFELPQQPCRFAVTEAMCVTTNGIVKADGHAVMGAGIAKQANDYFHLSEKLGGYLKQYGISVVMLIYLLLYILMFLLYQLSITGKRTAILRLFASLVNN